MVFESSAEEIPPGWEPHVKAVSSGRKIKNVEEDDAPPDWLPRGWMMVSRSRKNGSSAGSSYKIYVELKTGCKFYSKTQVMRYLESISNSALENQKQGGNDDKSFKQDALQDPQPRVGKSIVTGESNNQPVEISFEEVSGDKHLTREAPSNLQPLVDNTTMTREDDNNMIKRSLEAVDRSPVLDGFPPGWVKETRPRKTDRNKMDTYYVDPVSGYEFRSKMDARRYLETGDIRYCKIKPQKSLVKFQDDTSAPRTTDCLNIEPIAIDYHGAVSSSQSVVLQSSNLSEANKSKEREACSISTGSKSLLVDANEDKKLISEVIECRGSECNSEANIKGSNLSARGYGGRAVCSADLQDLKPAEDQLDMKTRTNLKKSKKRKALNIPVRSSKRLSGQEPEMQPMMLSSGKALQAAAKKSTQKKANSSVKEQKAAANGLPHQLDINQQSELPADSPFSCEVASLETEFQNNSEKPLLCQDVPAQTNLPSTFKISSVQTEMLNHNRKPRPGQDVPKGEVGQAKEKLEEENLGAQDSQVWYPFGDSLSDPCYEFAFKTLTGEIPIEETLAFRNFFQQPVEGHSTQMGLSAGLVESGVTPVFQSGVPCQPDPVQNNLPTELLPSNSNINSGSYLNFGGQQPSLDARTKNRKTKVNS